LNLKKKELNLFGEVKWEKVTEQYLLKYQELVRLFFEEIGKGCLKVRVMFTTTPTNPSACRRAT